jgi:hypothetical protein
VTEEQEDNMLSELFRHKLENAEVIPSASAGRIVMRRAGRMEFLRFNPGRFNIWYAGGIVAAGAALAIILSSGNGESDRNVPDSPESGKNIITDDPGTPITSSENQKPAARYQSNVKESINVLAAPSEPEKVKGTDGNIPEQKHNVPSRPEVTGTLPESGLFRETAGEKGKLRIVNRGSDMIKASITEGCSPLKVMFGKIALASDSCKWTFGDGGYSYKKSPEHIFETEGKYEVTLQIFDSKGLQSVSSSVIMVHPRPTARFEILTGNAITPDDGISFINYSTDAIKFKWDFGDGNTSDLFQPRHIYESSGNYNITLVATSENSCSDTIVVSNTYSGSGYFINFPNAFIPNRGGPSNGYYSPASDEAAHVFHPVYSGVSDYQLRIFSKLGVLIFESNDINIGWDGYYNGQLSEQGVYIWKAQGSFVNGEPFTKMGDLTLLKY